MFELLDTMGGHHLQCAGVICSSLDRHESGILNIAGPPDRFAGSAQACLDLWTDRDPLHKLAQYLREKLVLFMSSVEADFFSKKATADAKAERRGRHLVPCSLLRAKYSSRVYR